MKVLVDTSIWSLVLRKKIIDFQDEHIINAMKNLISLDSIVIIGAIRQEILSGIASEKMFFELSLALNRFDDLEISKNIYVKAANFFNICRKNGIQGSHTDFLICAVSSFYNVPIFTLDKDFDNYKKYLSIELYEL